MRGAGAMQRREIFYAFSLQHAGAKRYSITDLSTWKFFQESTWRKQILD